MDGWTDNTVFPYVAVTAHWIQIVEGDTRSLDLRSEIIGFYGLPLSHTGEHLAVAAIHIMDRVGIAEKVCPSLVLGT